MTKDDQAIAQKFAAVYQAISSFAKIVDHTNEEQQALWDKLQQSVKDLHEEIRRQAREQALAEALEALHARMAGNSQLAPETLLEAVKDMLGAERATILLKDPETGTLTAQGETIDDNEDVFRVVIDEVMRQGQPILTNNAQADPRFAHQQNIVMRSLRSIVAVPVKMDGEVIGAIYCDSRMKSGVFSMDDYLSVSAFVEQAAPALDLAVVAEKTAEEAEVPRTEAPAETQTVQFSAYYPTEITPGTWQTLYAYMLHDSAAPVVEAEVNRLLGTQLAAYRQAAGQSQQHIDEGTLITVTPFLPGVQFNPPSMVAGFFDEWQRFDFKLRAKDAPLEQATNGRLTFSCEGVIIAEIPLSIFVTRSPRPQSIGSAARQSYNSVFCSYSHQDAQVVERVERVCQSLGMTYLRDIHTLKSGEQWHAQLFQLIDKADIFQLFWSPAASTSPYVAQEWKYALSLTDRPAFIRPVYWAKPVPPIPPELSHLHFAFEPSLG